MINFRGFVRDLLLVSVSALIAVLVTHQTMQKQASPQQNAEGTVAGVEESTPRAGDSVNDQLTALREEMDRAHLALSRKIEMLGLSIQEPEDIGTVADRLFDGPSFEEQVLNLVDAENFDQQKSKQLQVDIDAHLEQLALSSSRMSRVECYSTKCVMEFEHDSKTDEQIFTEHVLFDNKGMFSSRFFYATEVREDGVIFTKLILDR